MFDYTTTPQLEHAEISPSYDATTTTPTGAPQLKVSGTTPPDAYYSAGSSAGDSAAVAQRSAIRSSE